MRAAACSSHTLGRIIPPFIILLPRIRLEALSGLFRPPRHKPKCDRTATGRHLLTPVAIGHLNRDWLPPVATGHLNRDWMLLVATGHLNRDWMPLDNGQVFKLPTDRSPR